jgi:hypothetical protein
MNKETKDWKGNIIKPGDYITLIYVGLSGSPEKSWEISDWDLVDDDYFVRIEAFGFTFFKPVCDLINDFTKKFFVLAIKGVSDKHKDYLAFIKQSRNENKSPK